MDKQTFDELAAQTKLNPKALRMAESVLCNGMSAANAGRQENATRQLADQAANRILKQMKLVDRYPDDWVTVTTVLPKAWAQLVLYIQTVEYAKAGLITKSVPKTPEFELTDIAEISKMVDTILKKWRKV